MHLRRGALHQPAAPQDLRHIKTIAVISALGNTFCFSMSGDTSIEYLGPPDSHFLEISDWKLDALVARDVTAALAKHFTIKPVTFETANFSSWNDTLLRRASLDLNGDPAIDAYVLILRDWHWDEIGYSVHDLGGLGLYRRDGVHPKIGIFASYRVVIVDALTGDTIASRAATLGNGALPWLAVAPALWPQTQDDLTDGQRATLLADETKLIEATLLPTLARLNLAR